MSAAEEVIQRLVTILGFKVDFSGQKNYDSVIANSQKRYEASYKKLYERVAAIRAKAAAKTVSDEQKTETQVQKTKTKTTEVVQREKEKEYNAIWKAAEKELKVREKVLMEEQTIRSKISQMKIKADQKDLTEAQRAAQEQSRISERTLDFEVRLRNRLSQIKARANQKDIADKARAEKKAAGQQEKDYMGLGIVSGMASRFLGGKISKAGSTYGDFEAQNLKVRAKSEGTDAELEGLKKQALQLGRKTQFDPIEIAGLQAELAGQNYNRKEIKSMTAPSLNIAAITGESPEHSAKLMSETLHQFGLQAKDSERVSNILGVSIGKLGLKMQNFAYTMKYAGSLAHTLGMSPEDAATLAVIMGRQGILGSTPGTALRKAMTDAVTKDDSKKILEKMKINPFNKDGNIDFIRTLQQLQIKTAKMTKADKVGLYSSLFGRTAFAPMMAIGEARGIGKVRNQLHTLKAGDIAGEMNQGYNFQMKQMTSSMLTLDKVIGEKLAPKLEFLANTVQKVSDIISNANPTLIEIIGNLMLVGFAATTMIASFVGFQMIKGYLAPVGTAIMNIWGYIKTATLAMWNFNYAALATPAMIFAIAAAVAFIGYEIYRTCMGGQTYFTIFANWVNKTFQELFGVNIPAMFDFLIFAFNHPLDAMKQSATTFLNWLKTAFNFYIDGISNLMSKISFGAVNINPTTAPLTGTSKSLVYSNQNIVTVHANGSKSSAQGIGNSVTNSLSAVDKKSLSGASKLYK